MLTVYALYNKASHKIYIGQTQDIDGRIQQHNEKHGKHFTAQFQGEWELIYSESVATRLEAIRREKQLKSSRGRAYVKQFISNP